MLRQTIDLLEVRVGTTVLRKNIQTNVNFG